MFGLSGIRLYLTVGLIAVIGLAVTGTGIYIWSLKYRLHSAQQTAQVATYANGRLNDQVKLSNKNVKIMKGVLDAQNNQYDQLRKEEQQQAKAASESNFELQALLAKRPSPAAAARLDQRMRTDLERIQGYPFDRAERAAFAAPAGNEAYCLDRPSTDYLFEDLEAVGRTLNLIYGMKDQARSSP